MAKDYEVDREVRHIQQALSQSKRPIGFLLSAGCPLAVRVSANGHDSVPLINDIAGLTKSIADELSASQPDEQTVWDKLLKTFHEDEIQTPNIEVILTRIRALKSVAGKGVVRSLNLNELEELDKEICAIIAREVDKELPTRETPFHNLAYWARAVRRQKPVHIFTTNYDLLLEQALEETRTRYFDGFVGARRGFFDLGAVEEEATLPASWTRLWKLHGSINWKLVRDDGSTEVIRTEQPDPAEKFLIFPSHLKYEESRKMPYLAMVDRLKAFLLMPSAVMFVSGYSFGDEHINDVISRALDSNPTAMLFGLLYGDLQTPEDPYAKAIECAKRSANLTLIARDRGVIGREIRSWKSSGRDTASIANGALELEEDKEGEENESNENRLKTCRCHLGDFSVFGDLLKKVSGASNDEDEHA